MRNTRPFSETIPTSGTVSLPSRWCVNDGFLVIMFIRGRCGGLPEPPTRARLICLGRSGGKTCGSGFVFASDCGGGAKVHSRKRTHTRANAHTHTQAHKNSDVQETAQNFV